MCALVGVWVVVYWFYEPAKPPVTFDPSGPMSGGAGNPGDTPIRPDPLAQLDPKSDAGKSPVPSRDDTARKARENERSAASGMPDAASRQPSGPRAVAPSFKEYVVERGDTFEVIARKMLGDAKHWKAIASANAFVDPRKLVPGRTVLRIPVDPDNVDGKVLPGSDTTDAGGTPRSPNAEPRTNPVTPPTAPADPPSASSTEYVIKSTDTLSSIAKEFYGKSSLWRAIYDANADVIDDPDRLKPGVTIRIPKNP